MPSINLPGVREAYVTTDLPVRVERPQLKRPRDLPRQDVEVSLALYHHCLRRLGVLVGGSIDADAARVVSPVISRSKLRRWPGIIVDGHGS